MWSLGCILAEMLLGKPLFPGTSTINQIEKIVSTIPLPQGREINEICSDYAQSILDKANTVAKRPLKEFLPDATSEAFSLVELLLKFNPSKRLTAHAGLRHPYVARFHNTAQVLVMMMMMMIMMMMMMIMMMMMMMMMTMMMMMMIMVMMMVLMN